MALFVHGCAGCVLDMERRKGKKKRKGDSTSFFSPLAKTGISLTPVPHAQREC